MQSEEQLLYAISLLKIKGLGSIKCKMLISKFGSPKEVFKQSHLSNTPGISNDILKEIHNFNDFSYAEKEMQFMQENQIETLYFLDDNYPKKLKECIDSPILLFCHNSELLNAPKVISIVGTRNASEYGNTCVNNIIQELQDTNCTVISGMAYGIDIASHQACLNHNIKTCAVVAHGMDRIYPAKHKATLNKMIENGGGLATEFLSNTEPFPSHFPRRNRIIAGLSDATIIVESKIKGGSMITAQLAHGYNREVFAIPGPIHHPQSSGCNKLIKENRAYLLESIKDLIYHLGWDLKKSISKPKVQLPEVNQNELSIITTLEKGIKSTDQIAKATKMPLSNLSLLLLDMEFKGYLDVLPGNLYRLSNTISPDSSLQLF